MSSLEEERREVLEVVGRALAAPDCDPDRAAACLHLLRHLGTGAQMGRPLHLVRYGRHQPPIDARYRE